MSSSPTPGMMSGRAVSGMGFLATQFKRYNEDEVGLDVETTIIISSVSVLLDVHRLFHLFLLLTCAGCTDPNVQPGWIVTDLQVLLVTKSKTRVAAHMLPSMAALTLPLELEGMLVQSNRLLKFLQKRQGYLIGILSWKVLES